MKIPDASKSLAKAPNSKKKQKGKLMNDYAQMITSEQFKELLPLAAAWAQEQESMILQNGEPLTAEPMDYARKLKITCPEKVRLLPVDSIPTPSNPFLREAVEITQLLGPQTIGLSLRYGIFIRSESLYDASLRIIIHELVHLAEAGVGEHINVGFDEAVEGGRIDGIATAGKQDQPDPEQAGKPAEQGPNATGGHGNAPGDIRGTH